MTCSTPRIDVAQTVFMLSLTGLQFVHKGGPESAASVDFGSLREDFSMYRLEVQRTGGITQAKEHALRSYRKSVIQCRLVHVARCLASVLTSPRGLRCSGFDSPL